MKFIAIGDLHIRNTVPENRIDNYIEAQIRKVKWLNELQRKYDAIILSPGDIFDMYNPPIELINWTIDSLPNMLAIPGNHDLPRHSLNLIDKSAIGILKRISKFGINSYSNIIILENVEIHVIPFGEKIYNPKKNNNKKILLTHTMVTKNEVFWSDGFIAKDLLIKFPEYDYMIIGDNHSSFIEEYNGRYLINCGSFMRMTIAQKEHKPIVYIVDTDSNTITSEYIPIEDNVFEEKKELESDLDILVEGISDDIELALSFTDSLEKNIKDEPDNIKNLIMECLENVK